MSGRETFEATFNWEGRDIRLSYAPRQWGVTDHVEIRSVDGAPLPITDTGYRSHFFGPVEPALGVEEVIEMIEIWLDLQAAKPHWRDYLAKSAQLTLF